MVVAAVVLPDVVDHGGRDDLEAVRVAALGQVAVVSALLHLEDLRQRDFLWEERDRRSGRKQTKDAGFVSYIKILDQGKAILCSTEGF